MHAEEQLYTPELVFGHLYTSSNYTDNDGRHGLGAKLANIFSTHFRVECLDNRRRKRFRMEWEHNMRTRHEPVVTDVAPNSANARDYTETAFRPDLERFGMTCLDKDTVALLTKRVYDIAGCNPSVRVSLNERWIRLDDFEAYVGLYLNCKKGGPSVPHVFRQIDERWSVCVALSESGQFQQVSFVNSVCTTTGGVHVNRVYESLWKQLASIIDRQNEGGDTASRDLITPYVWLFVNCRLPKPEFDSQIKQNLASYQPIHKVAAESLWQLPTDYIQQGILLIPGSPLNGCLCANRSHPTPARKVARECKIVERVLELIRYRQQVKLDTVGRISVQAITKLDDALLAGSKHARECTLILTEGDSAKTFAVSGVAIVGREKYGVFPLKGKLLNVRGATRNQIAGNEELKQVATILGLSLRAGQQNIDFSTLRYGRLMIMADQVFTRQPPLILVSMAGRLTHWHGAQDHDGSHIKGLIINAIHHLWPGLLRTPGFLTEFVTPVVKVRQPIRCRSGQLISLFPFVNYASISPLLGDRDGQEDRLLLHADGLREVEEGQRQRARMEDQILQGLGYLVAARSQGVLLRTTAPQDHSSMGWRRRWSPDRHVFQQEQG
jgi:DNA topoisomerase-2